MRGIRITGLVGATALLLAAAGPAAAQAKPRVAVIEFKNKVSGWSWYWYHAGEKAQDMFVTELVKRGSYRVWSYSRIVSSRSERNAS